MTAATVGVQPAPAPIGPTGLPHAFIKRTTAPQTTNGRRWEVELSAVPAPEWLELFRKAGASSATSAPAPPPGRARFDRASIVFESDEHHVEAWIEALDAWIACAGARYARRLDEADRERSLRLEAAAEQRERIRRLNERFKNL